MMNDISITPDDSLAPLSLTGPSQRVLEVGTLTLWRDDYTRLEFDRPGVRSSVHLNAHVELCEEIGRGATGQVYSARVTETGETIAVKKLALVLDVAVMLGSDQFFFRDDLQILLS